jgi:hypothetical protein
MKRLNVQTFKRWNISISPRRELRFALLAAMETCWVYSILAYLAFVIGVPHSISAFTLFAAYWIALIAGRGLPQRKERWIILQLAAIGIAVVTMLTVARIELYPFVNLLDLSWLPRYVQNVVTLRRGIAPEHLAAVGVLYAFTRGLGLGQRPMTLWFTGFQFRLGIVVFFLLILCSGLIKPFDPSPWVFAYFFLSLLAIALARMEEMESDVQYGPRWAVTLVAAVGLVLFLGILLLQFLTLNNVDFVWWLLAPLWMLIALVVTLIAIPLGLLMNVLVDLLSPVFGRLSVIFQILQSLIPPEAADHLQNAPASSWLRSLEPFLKTMTLLGIVLVAGILIANALNRRIKRGEDEEFIRESLSKAERRAERAGMPKKKNAPPRAAHVSAESIRRIYAALVARASEAGLPRAAAETPYEYLPRLQRSWPQRADDVRAITDAYVEVHYGEREFGAAEVDRLRAVWRQVEPIIKRKM